MITLNWNFHKNLRSFRSVRSVQREIRSKRGEIRQRPDIHQRFLSCRRRKFSRRQGDKVLFSESFRGLTLRQSRWFSPRQNFSKDSQREIRTNHSHRSRNLFPFFFFYFDILFIMSSILKTCIVILQCSFKIYFPYILSDSFKSLVSNQILILSNIKFSL